MSNASNAPEIMPYSWLVRFDVAPLWIADGFLLDDDRAMDMIGKELGQACQSTELAATVLSAPAFSRIAEEQGYGPKHFNMTSVVAEMQRSVPSVAPGGGPLVGALVDAIGLLESVAFVREEGDDTGKVLDQLRIALALVNGSKQISDIDWQPVDD